MRLFGLLIFIIGIAAGVIYSRFGTLEPCGILRMRVREQATAQHGVNAMLAAALPDEAVDALMAARYGPLTPQRCISALIRREEVSPP